jgi:hypothetical protein
MTFAQVDAFATKLAGVEVTTRWNHRTWQVNERGIAWERPFSKADIARFGDEAPPAGEILAIATPGLDAKDALLSIALPGFFTIPHFNGFPAVLVELRTARVADVRRALTDAYRAALSAPPKRARPRARRGG